jgi:hypothetical protein
MERKQLLEEQLRVAQQRLNARRAEASSAAERKTVLETAYQQQQAKITQMQTEIQKTKPAIERLVAENRELGEKMKRAAHTVGKTRDGIRRAENVPPDAKYPATLLEMDVELRILRSTLDAGVTELSKLAETNREIEAKLRLGLTQIGLQMKPLPGTLASPRVPQIVTPVGSTSGSSKSGRSGASFRSRGSLPALGSSGSQSSRASVQNLDFPG